MVRPEKRGLVWIEMGKLEQHRLGRRVNVSSQREKFVLTPMNAAASKLTTQPDRDGFIRADRGSLLFRHASPAFRTAIPMAIRAKEMPSTKGLEFRWTKLELQDIRELLSVVASFAAPPGSAPDSTPLPDEHR